ncbi:type II citrate synthase [Corynebacterium diphtheriae HC01]|nr:type II citrate synthase [Corynebacterium diphtheriae 31A]AEX43779.1 type II citrate synthase [Corynebacterium diphtheriae 241]AEX46002.1 type II citrate synthase [Corynebacterium diphtheriae INCA 402]AEX73965.1 type II citrate synthase [Corynebacterium diphtheriae HC01]AEX78439.1 type II citrate synthase [Corynebacterium diphtheriae HC03]AEX80706.1 type II citrate synthase [Corynebacterium diphtheriae HC04]AEX82940.1 type II citrate synthase [Corynebacterium diphtheriae VA01]ARB88938.1 c
MATENKDKAVLHYPGGEYEMDIIHATEGNDGVVLDKLLSQTGMVTFDPGYVSTGSTESKITYIDGDNGILRHRGYDIADLAENATFNEVSYLLIKGHLPTVDELHKFNNEIRHHTLLDEDFKSQFNIFPRDAHPMSVLASSVNILSTYYQDQLNPLDEEQLDKATVRLLAKVPMLAAYAYRASKGAPYMYPDNSLNARENFLRMMFGYPTEPYEVDPVVAKALDKLLILHADHEQNCSTSTVRMIGSAQANMFVAVAGGINALSGPLHGGANQAVLEMLEEIKANGGDATDFMNRVKNKEKGVRLMGFGHRVYKNYDPRAAIVKETAHEILEHLGGDELLDLAMKLEEIALSDDYFVSRKLYPNVDFYTGLIYRAMGFPTDFFTVLFAIGRLPGWIAQYREQLATTTKINRPRQIYTGETLRKVTPREQR